MENVGSDWRLARLKVPSQVASTLDEATTNCTRLEMSLALPDSKSAVQEAISIATALPYFRRRDGVSTLLSSLKVGRRLKW